MHNAQKVSISILALLWTIGSIRLLFSGSFLLLGSVGTIAPWIVVLCFVLAAIIGFAKGKFLLSKTASRSITNSHRLEDNTQNLFLGWARIMGVRGLIMISLMLALGFFLAGPFSPLDGFGRGLLRIAIGTALLIGSFSLWSGIRSNNKALS